MILPWEYILRRLYKQIFFTIGKGLRQLHFDIKIIKNV